MEEKRQFGGLFVMCSGMLWALNGPFVKVLTGLGASAALASFFRMAFALAVLAPILLIGRGKKAFCVSRRTLISAAAMGLVCQTGYNLLYSASVMRVGVSMGAVLLAVAPVFSAIGGRIAYRERFGVGKLMALALNVVGCVLAVTGGRFSGLSLDPIGILMGVGAGFCYSLTPLIGRYASEECDPVTLCAYTYLFATVFLLLLTNPLHGITLTAPLLLVGFLFGLVPTALSYLIYYKGVSRIKEPSRVPIFASIEPVVAMAIGAAFFSETVTVGNLAGLAVVLLSIALIAKAR